MPHHTPLIATLVGGLVLAFILGAVAQRFRISPLVGYLLAGFWPAPPHRGLLPTRRWPPTSPRSA